MPAAGGIIPPAMCGGAGASTPPREVQRRLGEGRLAGSYNGPGSVAAPPGSHCSASLRGPFGHRTQSASYARISGQCHTCRLSVHAACFLSAWEFLVLVPLICTQKNPHPFCRICRADTFSLMCSTANNIVPEGFHNFGITRSLIVFGCARKWSGPVSTIVVPLIRHMKNKM